MNNDEIKTVLDEAVKCANEPESKCTENSEIIKEMQKCIDEKNRKIEDLRKNLIRCQDELFLITNSRGYMLLQKFRNIFGRIAPRESKRFKAIKLLLFPVRYIMKKRSTSKNSFVSTPEEQYKLLSETKKINIRTVNHTLFVAELLKQNLNENGYSCDISTGNAPYEDGVPYIVIGAQVFDSLPPVYIVYQMEQTVSSRWLTDEYISRLENAYAVFDYSMENIKYFCSNDVIAKKLYYVPIDVLKNSHHFDASYKEYDILFYGDIENERRKRIIGEVGKKYRVKVISGLFGEELYEEMARAKVILNIHYYENALLETTRLYEVLSVCHAMIVSEHSSDKEADARLDGIVDFVDVDDVSGLISKLDFWLSDEKRRKSEVEKRTEKAYKRANEFNFYFERFLLANDMMTFDEFYERNSEYISFDKDTVCLSLKEAVERKDYFDGNSKVDFQYFPGLKHRAGWKGCAMSYKFIAQKALEQGIDEITVCEDDVLFPEDFSERYLSVCEYLNENKDWDLFSGIIADIKDISVTGRSEFKGETIVNINRMVSMVFNRYGKKALAALSRWTDSGDIYSNTIDRYLQNGELNVITTTPFLVGHNEDLMSTIWNFSNRNYSDSIKNSSDEIAKMAEEFGK